MQSVSELEWLWVLLLLRKGKSIIALFLGEFQISRYTGCSFKSSWYFCLLWKILKSNNGGVDVP